ncbi:putative golgi apparatus protein cysteine-rich fibroblast growth factor receptor [Operophtera brumata]|uniref:Putative golgi apparatus protein cysteine-rich fibroblast growth factor receptor n=1 Tax=Operophtera brumata TaxID=104452 RepID=A0A0L7LRR6_OPEBR|nr:putative golgi apparatus protein cysteine-rich fibroblast growth factor receptor [Operophtera brumata]
MLSNTISRRLCVAFIVICIQNVNVLGNNLEPNNDRFRLDLSKCSLFQKLCSYLEDDLAVLSCTLNVAYNKTQVTPACQQTVWTHQNVLLDNAYLDYKLKQPCVEEPTILNCLKSPELVIDCILTKKLSVNNKECWSIINKIESLIFNDWQITGNFLKNCYADIQAYTCGRIPQDSKGLSQIQTLKCLQIKEQNLSPECLPEVIGLQDMKYNTLQLNRIIFAACNLDQKNFCPDEVPGSWLMYNRGLVRSCKEDIRKYHCRKGVVDDKDVRLAQILLCLENVTRNDSTKLAPECTAEMTDHRKMLMEDYRLSPELMQNCANDILTLCKGIEAGGKTIHCLMEHARPRRRKEKRISMGCQKSLENLVQEADPGEDWRVDPILRKACKPVVDKACQEVIGGNGRVMSCLMEKLGTVVMTPDCEAALIQIQYFISRDFKLDPQLYKACKYDAVTLCKSKFQWPDASDARSEKDLLVLPCLYNYAYSSDQRGKLRPNCEHQVRRAMRQRAISVDLLPEIEDVCIDDLALLCIENSGKGEEISCLQDKIKDLSPKCRDVVNNFTETQSGHIELNTVVNVNCRVPMERLCSSELKNKKDEDDVMDCLISHKNDPEIKANVKCRAAIEHEQIISLKNYRFTRKFKNSCKSYVVRYCPKAQTKTQVMTCLSEIVRNDTIARRKHTILKDCRQQIRSQLFQQKESIDLDPELKEACKLDLQLFCPKVPHGESAALECLQTASGKLSEACQKAIFVVKKQEFTDNAIDYHLITSCNGMIDLYCHNTETSKILDCLKVDCKLVIVNRMIEQNTDYRFNNNLQDACKVDIQQHCSEEKFRESKLTTPCENELANVLKEQALNYRLDPLLGRLCKAEIQTICSLQTEITNSEGQMNVIENLGDVYTELSTSPSKKYFLVVGMSVVGLIFIFGLYCGRITKKAMYVKRK